MGSRVQVVGEWCKMRNLAFFTALLLLSLAFQGRAEIYKWVDAQGQIHYGENPPDANAARVIILDNPVTDNTVQKQNTERDKLLKIYEEERNIRKEEERRIEEETRKKAEKCLVVEKELKGMQQGGVLYYIDEKGERRYLSDAEVNQRIRKLQELYDRQCT